jgi:cytochrome P450
MIVLLIVAGHETTAGLIGNAMLALFEHPEQRAMLEGDPSLMPGAVEELIRYDGPVERADRYAAEDVELGGQAIHRGDHVKVFLGSANRDPDVFENPDKLDLTAKRQTRHLGFALGSHFCLGAPLARLETEIALATLLRRLPGLRLAVAENELHRQPGGVFRRLDALPVAWDT